MPAQQPFTTLCQATARRRTTGRADLHLHTTYSDGSYTPFEIVDLAVRSGLAAVAVTDHDTLAGVAVAQKAAHGTGIDVIPGVEITAEYGGQEVHLLGYFVRLDDAALLAALERLQLHRAGRFEKMVDRMRSVGVELGTEAIHAASAAGTLGRRHLAQLLVRARVAGSVHEAFARYLRDGGRVAVPKLRLPVAQALALVRGAGGVASWAHPSYDCQRQSLAELRSWGLGAVEVEYPNQRDGRRRDLRSWAAELGLAVTGGSDCHGPGEPRRSVGACGVTREELAVLRQMIAG